VDGHDVYGGSGDKTLKEHNLLVSNDPHEVCYSIECVLKGIEFINILV